MSRDFHVHILTMGPQRRTLKFRLIPAADVYSNLSTQIQHKNSPNCSDFTEKEHLGPRLGVRLLRRLPQKALRDHKTHTYNYKEWKQEQRNSFWPSFSFVARHMFVNQPPRLVFNGTGEWCMTTTRRRKKWSNLLWGYYPKSFSFRWCIQWI